MVEPLMTPEECEEWRKNPGVNPRTKRKIQENGVTAKKIAALCNGGVKVKTKSIRTKTAITPSLKVSTADCAKFVKDRTKNPLTGRKIKPSKTGIYAQLLRLCKDTKNADISTADRNRLGDAIKKYIAPIISKGDSTKARVHFYNIMTKYVNNIQPCLIQMKRNVYLVDNNNTPIIKFDQRIGSESVYGIAYMNMGKGFAKLLKFSCKLMSAGIPGHAEEIKILDKMSKLAIEGKCPNMPITYKSMRCDRLCGGNKCPSVTYQGSYFVVINELASCDIQTWFAKRQYRTDVYESVIMQILFGIYSFHRLGYSHNDAHLGNFLIHNIKPGGYWRYQIKGLDVYVPNHGYLLVMWDPGLASRLVDYRVDYKRPLQLIETMPEHSLYQRKALIQPSADFINYVIRPMLKIVRERKPDTMNLIQQETSMLTDVLIAIRNGEIDCDSVKVGTSAPGVLLNIKPYTLF